MAVNKVNLANGETLVDLTGDSVNAETLAEGTTAHDASGNPIIGKMPTTNVLYTEQTLTEAQKAQARENIGAQPVGSYLESTELTSAIDTALAQAKASGEFDGDKGEQGIQGEPGADGKNGEDGKTPVKGVDYWTPEDKAEIVEDVLAEMPDVPGSGSALPPVTAENNGAFLRVVDGAWAVATIPSAEGVSF